jgi:hypothetical protein
MRPIVENRENCCKGKKESIFGLLITNRRNREWVNLKERRELRTGVKVKRKAVGVRFSAKDRRPTNL